MKHMHTPSQTFIAVKFETTGSVLLKPFDVVKKFNIVVTPKIGKFIHYSNQRKQNVTLLILLCRANEPGPN